MIVVADTSPINYLVLLGLEDLLSTSYGKVLLPEAVLSELCHPGTPRVVSDWAKRLPDWIEIRQPTVLDGTLSAQLGAGERHAISLAMEVGAKAILIDEAAGRREAGARNLSVVGTLGILLDASTSSKFDFRETLTQLRNVGFRLSLRLETDALAEYQEMLRRSR